MKKLLALSMMLLLAAGTAFAAGELKIGVQGPLTGNLAAYGVPTADGAKLAVKEINAAGGVNGMMIKLVSYDSRADKAEAANATQRLINKDKVCGIIGEPTSGATFVIGPIANRSGVVLISAGATAKGVTDKKPFVFRDTLLDTDGGPATVKFVMDKFGYKNFALITSINNDYSVGLSKIFKDAVIANGGKIVVESTISDGDTDFSAQITSIKPKNPEVIIFSGYYPEGSLIMLEAAKQGLKAHMMGADGIGATDLYTVGKDAVVGTIFYNGFTTESNNPKVATFIKGIEAMNSRVDMFSAQGYDAVYLLTDAMKKSGLTDCKDRKQRKAMRDVLAKTKDFMGVSGKLTFDSEGNATKKPAIQRVEKTSDGYKFKLLN